MANERLSMPPLAWAATFFVPFVDATLPDRDRAEPRAHQIRRTP